MTTFHELHPHKYVNTVFVRQEFVTPDRDIDTETWAKKILLDTPGGHDWARKITSDLAIIGPAYFQLVDKYNDLLGKTIELIANHEACSACADGKNEAAEFLCLDWRFTSEYEVSFTVDCSEEERYEIEEEIDAILGRHDQSFSTWSS